MLFYEYIVLISSIYNLQAWTIFSLRLATAAELVENSSISQDWQEIEHRPEVMRLKVVTIQ